MFSGRSLPPLLRAKQAELDVQDLCGLLQIHWQLGTVKLRSALYTRVDQALLLWGAIAFAIFATAQFSPLSWVLQAYLWSALAAAGAIATVTLTWFWARVERLAWIVYLWVALVVAGVVLTDLGIFCGWGLVLVNLCPLWLGLAALGYALTGLGLRSRTFGCIGGIHALAIALLPGAIAWQFLFAGLVLGGCLLVLSELQWDMRAPVESPVLTDTEREFNRQQARRRTTV